MDYSYSWNESLTSDWDYFWNESQLHTANFTYIFENYTFNEYTRTDLDALFTAFGVISLCAILTNLALLVALVARMYQYRKGPVSQKSKWARLHFLGVLCVVHVIKLDLMLFVSLPWGEEWVSRDITTCRLSITLKYGLQLLGWLYLLTIGIQTFFQVYHPKTLLKRNQFVFWLLVHPCLWIFSFAVSYGTEGQFYDVRIYQGINTNYAFCLLQYTKFEGWFELIEAVSSIGMLLYIAFISAIGICLVKPVPSSIGQNDEMLRWLLKSRVNAAIFVVAVAFLAGGTSLVNTCVKSYFLIVQPMVYDYDQYMLLSDLLVVDRCLELVYPACCLILREVGLCSLIGKYTRGARQNKRYDPPSSQE